MKANKIYPRHFERLADDADISYTQLKRTIREQCDILPDIVKEISDSFENTIEKDILSVVQKTVKEIWKILSKLNKICYNCNKYFTLKDFYYIISFGINNLFKKWNIQ